MNKTMTVSSLQNATSPPALLSGEQGICFCIAFLLEMVAIVIGNSIAIGAFTRQRQLWSRSFYLLVNLAVADVLVGGVEIPLRVYILALHFNLWAYKGGYQVSIAYATLGSFVHGASLTSLVMISLERMYAIVWPMNHCVMKTKVYYALIGLVWCFSCIVPTSHLARHYGWIPQIAELVIWLTFLASCLLFISINYIAIWIKCRFGATTNRMASGRERRLAMSLFLMTMVSMATILPAPITYIDFHFSPGSNSGGCLGTCRLAYLSTLLLYDTNSLVNPIIYTFRMPEFREYAVRLVCRRSREERVDVTQMRIL